MGYVSDGSLDNLIFRVLNIKIRARGGDDLARDTGLVLDSAEKNGICQVHKSYRILAGKFF